TRIVWFTFLAAMDEDGFARFAAVENLAHRARVSVKAATAAVAVLEAPDPNSTNKDHDGRRIERVPGGWMVLNAQHYKDIVTSENSRVKTRERVRKFREKQAKPEPCNADVTPCNNLKQNVTPSETETETEVTKRTRVREGSEVRLHGIPSTVDEVIAWGKACSPPKTEATCRDLWSSYEGRRKTNENGEIFWISGGENPSTITNWRVYCLSFVSSTKPQRGPNGK